MLIFQYGSNCSNAQINGADRLCGDAIFVGIARADGFELAFDVWSKNRGCAAADIVRKTGSCVWGVLYEVPDYLVTRDGAKSVGRKSLDQIEGEGKNYQRQDLEVFQGGVTPMQAVTYTVKEPKAGLQTSLTYVQMIVSGLRERGVDGGYIEAVKRIASKNCPEVAEVILEL